MSIIVSTHYKVTGVHDDDDVRKALQSLYDIFAEHGLGQATFEIRSQDDVKLIIKHKDDVIPNVAEMNKTLASAGNYEIVSR